MTTSVCKSYISDTSYNVKDNIYLIQQFFINSNTGRQNEIIDTLRRNTDLEHITKIFLLNEKIYTQKELGVNEKQMTKIQQININKRLTFKDVFTFQSKKKLKGYIIFSNSDIFFDKTIKNLYTSPLATEKTFMAQLRFEFNPTERFLQKSKLFTEWLSFAQDTWIYHTNFQPSIDIVNKIFDIPFGKPGCDNKLIYLMKIQGYNIINNPYLIKTYHNHYTQLREYTQSDRIQPPYLRCIPELPKNFNMHCLEIDKRESIYLNQSNMGERFDTVGENNILYNYISDKIIKNNIFIIPIIAGVENNLIHKVATNSITQDFINKVLPVMKKNAGILFNTTESLIEYSKRYIDAFSKCDTYFDWEKWGDVYKYISNSHDFITNNICVNKQPIWAFSLDIFNSIKYTPWTTSLKGKRILIVSPFIKSMKSKLSILHKIYDIDLFPECEFVFIKHPQTQGDNSSRGWLDEINEFCIELDKLGDKYDIALVSAGGYGNLICGEIFNRGKSAIYVGGVLQMYFGIIGNRWEVERPDIIKMYMNKYWTRPNGDEKPKNHTKI